MAFAEMFETDSGKTFSLAFSTHFLSLVGSLLTIRYKTVTNFEAG